ncbi:CBF-domain-containing protein [Heliocybe sulcata]|uniref:CBF-domain-containing protein n=1 Tax=Heliocybe sulcata TaxID=5364 RepID=A0A5C3N4R7_9AGAM|nr:CBF-domain-containing protein [Heliocybe sulcata]
MGRKSKGGLKLGGDEGDLELLKGIEKGIDASSNQAAVDPTLTTDVSKFLKELRLGDSANKPGKKGSKESPKKNQGKKLDTPVKEKGGKKADVPAKHKDSKKTESKSEKKDKTSDANASKGKRNTGDSKPTRKSDATKSSQSQRKATAPSSPSNPTKIVFEPSLIPQKPSTAPSDLDAVPHIPATPAWYTLAPSLPPPSSPLPLPTPQQLATLSSRAQTLFSSLPPPSSSSSTSASETTFLQKIMQSGTLADKLSALTLVLQGSPIHHTRELDVLKGMAAKGGGRDERLKACRCIVDWWVGGGAPDRKLKYFRDQPLTHPSLTPTHLLVWHFEDHLKKFFFSFLQLLESLTLDPLPYPRMQALSFVHTLLRDKSEQEQNLLRLIVNKLGDPTKQVPSRASYYLLQLLQTHPAMKGVVVREIASLMFRPASSSSQASSSSSNTHVRFSDNKKSGESKKENAEWNAHALYYGTITLNQIVLSHSETDRSVARALVDVYFKIFEGIVGSAAGKEDVEAEAEAQIDPKGGKDSKGKGKWDKGQSKKEKKGKDSGDGFSEVEDANSKLVSQVLTGVNPSQIFTTHIDTLFRITHTATFSTSLQALTLLLQITTTFSSSPSPATTSSASTSTAALASSIKDRFYRTLYGTLLDPRLAGTGKHAMYLNLLLKALKLDVETGNGKGKGTEGNERVKAVVRRLVQVLLSGGVSTNSEVVVGGMWVLGELFSTVPGLRAMVNEPPSDSEEEYDPKKRDPQYAHAGASPMWELVPMLTHYHPTISLHARQLLLSQPVTSSPDLSLNSLGHFLDRFVYKNPKKVKNADEDEEEVGGKGGKGGSVMQPAAADGTGVRKLKGGQGEEEAVREEGWWRRSRDRVPVDQLFFHRYFNEKDQKEKERRAKKVKRKGGEDEEDASAEEDEDDQEVQSGEEKDDEEGAEESDQVEDEDEEEDARSHFDDSESDAEEGEIWKAMKASMRNMDDMADLDLMEDSEDDVPSGLDDDDVPSVLEEDDSDGVHASGDDEAMEEKDENGDEGEDEEDAFSLAEASDAEDLIDLDADLPDGLIPYDGSEAELEGGEWGGIAGTPGKKRKHQDKKDEGRRRKKLKSLPTFASYDDYKKMIEEGPEDNI